MEVMVDVGKNATDMVSGLATQLNMSVNEVLPYYVKAAQITAISEVVVLCLVVWGISIAWVRLKALLARSDFKKDDVTGITITMGALGVAVAMVCLILLPHSLTTAISPQAHAISDMINDASKLLGK